MVKKSWSVIENFLGTIEKLEPQDTEVSEKIEKKTTVKALIFDIYGTLLISDSGDIDQTHFSIEITEAAIEKSGIEINADSREEKDSIIHQIMLRFKDTIRHVHREKMENNIPFPEIDVIDIWEKVLDEAENKDIITIPPDTDLRVFAMLFELNSNRIYPMPRMKETLIKLSSLQYPIGIISNAQFYTPVIMNYFLKGVVSDAEKIAFFDPELCFFSYQVGISKPDSLAFNKLKNRLKKQYGIHASETLYIGNDMYKDIYPARNAGFQTVLFAGDKRSLRLRNDYAILNGIQPDFVIKDLSSIFQIIQ
jgi:putative hydrolase of the HAD superfamily